MTAAEYPPRPRPRIPCVVLLAPLVLIALLALGWAFMAFITRGPLAGETKHNFGVIAIPTADGIELSHTFHLTNRTNDGLLLRSARPDCGCLTVNAAFPMTIYPGESIDLPIAMRFGGRSGHQKTVLIHLDFVEFGMQTLRVKATAQ
jgi:hypothetical protein